MLPICARIVRISGLSCCVLIGLLGAPVLFGGEAAMLDIELWVPQSAPQPGLNGESNGSTDEDGTAALLIEARLLIAAMIYGYEFVYVPVDVNRAVAEEFRLRPRGRIAGDDAHLAIRSVRQEDGRLYGRVGYRLSDEQCRRMAAWESSRLPSAGGSSGLSLAGATRQQALEEAVRMALRQHLRGRIASKPKRVVGTLQLAAAPRLARDPTGWRAAVRLKVRVARVEPYLVY